ncbi:hypothetical protein TRFO_09928 [Tritrichomonas foetus]|uniref:Uncharacterized protein n=1 Tax=Tritrichomonas foetus TaxID=1144522 RepID=A0A1J4JE17_9EUKA|nr:hypothetical protein TRFO_09928 [Tritrichomonas foetus]|eukprot:OHS96535.1 hypothetical protein TRFO_09928 [Tritrichomonas foetus]
MFGNYAPLVDYEKYVISRADKVQQYLNPPSSSHFVDCPTPEWAAEQLLLTFEKFQSHITKTKLTDEIVSKWRSIKHEYKMPKNGDIVLCRINSVDYYDNSNKPVLNLSPSYSQQKFGLWLHPSLLQFIDANKFPTIFSPSRQIRFVASQILNDYFMLPVRCVVLELNSGSINDLKFVKENSQPNILHSLNYSNIDHSKSGQSTTLTKSPISLFVQVVDKTESSFLVQDDSINDPIEFILQNQEKNYLKLINESDFILIWRPVILNNPLSILCSHETVIFRAPQLDDYEYHHERSICGVIDSIVHFTLGIEWNGCQIELITKNNNRKIIVFTKQTQYNSKKVLSTLQIGHFAYFFHLIRNSQDYDSFLFKNESTLFNLNILTSFLESGIIRPIPIFTLINNFTSGVVRATILNIEISESLIHIDCNCAVDKHSFCQRCLSNVNGRCLNIMLIKVTLDDGNLHCLNTLTAFGYSSSFNLLGFDIDDWNHLKPNEKNEILRKIVGKELVFFLSKCNPLDFNMGASDEVWRVDAFSEGQEETKRTVKYLMNNLLSDTNKYQIGCCGESKYQNS